MPNQYKNKVVYDGNVLIDLTADTVDASHLLSGYTAHDKSGATITGACTYNADTTDATASQSEILATKTAYVNGVKLTGTMPNNGANNVTVTNKTGTTIPAGYYDGSGKAQIDSTSATNLIASNIRDGVTILGVEGSMTGEDTLTVGAASATPTSSQQVITAASLSYDYITQVTVAAIPYVESDNSAGGVTVTIG
jgi:hypothetical protein